MVKRNDITRQILKYATGIGTEMLFTVFLVIIAFAISILALRWF